MNSQQSPQQSGGKVDMRASYSPTQADPSELPEQAVADQPLRLSDDDDGKQASNGDKPSLMNVSTNDIARW